MTLDSQSISMALAIVAICVAIYLYRKTSIEIDQLKCRPPVVLNRIPSQCVDEVCEEEKPTEEVTKEE